MASAPNHFHGGDFFGDYVDEDLALAFARSLRSLEEDEQWAEVGQHVLDESAKDESNELRFVVIGETGSGKSETSNSILLNRDLFRTSMSATSVTKNCVVQKAEVMGRTISIVDTPGLFDADMDATSLLREITRCTMMTAPGPHALLLVIRIGRMSQQVQETVRIFREVFGDKCTDHMIVVFTWKKSLSDVRKGCTVEQYISTVEKEVADMLKDCQNRYVVFENSVDAESEENEVQVQELLSVVDEMMRSNGRRCYTSDMFEEAARKMNEKERECLQKYENEEQQEIRAIRKMYEDELREIEHHANQTMVEMMIQSRDHDIKGIEEKYSKKDARHEVRKQAENGSLWESFLRTVPTLCKVGYTAVQLYMSYQRNTLVQDLPRHWQSLSQLLPAEVSANVTERMRRIRASNQNQHGQQLAQIGNQHASDSREK